MSVSTRTHFVLLPNSNWLARIVGALVISSSAFGQATWNVTNLPAPLQSAHPSDGADDTAAIRAALAALPSNTTLKFDEAGIYELSGPMQPVSYPEPLLELNGATTNPLRHDVGISAVADVTIQLNGFDRSQMFKNYPIVLDVRNCDNVTVSGAGPGQPLTFTTRGAATPTPGNEGLPFVQGELLEIHTAPNWVKLKVTDPEMFLPPPEFVARCWGAWGFDTEGGGNRPVDAVYGGNVRPLGAASEGRQFVKVEFTGSKTYFTNWPLHGQVVVELNQSDMRVFSVNACTGKLEFRNLVANHIPGDLLFLANGDEVVVDDVDAVPANSSRLMSVCRGAVEVGGKQVTVSHCDLTGTGDDALVVFGSSWGEVVAAPPCSSVPPGLAPESGQFRLRPPSIVNSIVSPLPPYAGAGEFIVLLDRNTLSSSTAEYATTVNASTPVAGYPNVYQYSFTNPTPGFVGRLSSPCEGNYAYCPTESEDGALVHDCTITTVRGAGIIIRATLTQVSDTEISDTHECGIFAGGGIIGAYPWWSAGAPPHYLTIDGCTLTRCSGGSTDVATNGAIDIEIAKGYTENGTCGYYVNPVFSGSKDVIVDVQVINNTIQDFKRAGVFAANVGELSPGSGFGIVIAGNLFKNSGPLSCHPQHGAAVALESCAKGYVTGNTYENCQKVCWQHSSVPGVTFSPQCP